ncbi:hypothetical protein L1D34_10960 [Vibrio mediterranei]|uniref:hypothetical protein n=1 Tax=Vibrio mediterranei TaxID=689 RepID=UPI001EFE5C2A|nr:hypothetical protein [Vibrio mediterranei]MCG9625363.1 hypothetical protein [Vibrio mediterranei]
MTLLKKVALYQGLLLGILLAGCASDNYQSNLATNEAVHEEISQLSTVPTVQKVTHINKPPIEISPIEEKLDQRYLDEQITVNVSDMPLSVVLEDMMAGTGVPVWLSEDVSPNKKVTLNFSATRQAVLNLLSRETGYGIQATPERLEITRYLTETFTLNLPSGKVTGQLGSQGSASGEDSSRIEGQYLNVEYDGVEIINEIALAVENLLGGEEVAKHLVSTSKALSSITVKATPDQMASVRRLIGHYQAMLEKQVSLDIRVIEFRSNLGTERGIDWNLVKQTSHGALKFFVPGTNTLSEGTGYGLAFTGSGAWNGTETFIKVLEKQGSVATQTPITALMLSNQPARVVQEREVPYLYDVSSESSEGVVSASVTRDKEMEGVDMMINANVQQDNVWLRISGQLRKIVQEKSESVENLNLKFLTVEKSEITFANKLRYGQTMVIASVKQTSTTAEQTKNFWTSLFGGTGSKSDTTETLVLLTPRKTQ